MVRWLNWVPCAWIVSLPLALSQEATFRAGVSLVGVDVQVDGAAHPIHGLQKEDFRVSDEGEPQFLVRCSEGEDPLDLLLLFDISTSMRPGMMLLASSLRSALRELRPGDRIAAMSFTTFSRLELPLTDRIDAAAENLAARIKATRFLGGTFILDAVADAAKYLKAHGGGPERRRAILIFTDNDGYGPAFQKSVLHHVEEANATVSGIIIPNAGVIAARVGPYGAQRLSSQDDINPIADETGGEVINGADPGAAFQEIVARMRERYTLYYAMPAAKAGQRRSVTVALSTDALARFPGARTSARKNYIVPKDPK